METQETGKRIFRQESLDRISSPDQLDTYLHVTSVGVYILLAAIIALLAAFFVWNIMGTLPNTVVCNGIAKNGTVTCYLEPDTARTLSGGLECTVGERFSGRVKAVADQPMSLNEAAAEYNDYSVYMLKLSDWNYEVTIDAPDCPDGFTTVSMITGVLRPIDFFIN